MEINSDARHLDLIVIYLDALKPFKNVAKFIEINWKLDLACVVD